MLAALVLAACANNDPELDLAAALARRGWIELAEELCVRIDKNPGASAAAKAGVPLVLAEVAIARARTNADVVLAAKELDLAVERLNRPGHKVTLDERGMTGWLHVQKARILSVAAEEDGARRPDAIRAWEATAAFYRRSLGELLAMPGGRPVDEAVLESRLELPKALAALARAASRPKLHEEAIDLLFEFQFNALQPIVLEARLEEGRSRADLGQFDKAERCFRSLPGMAKDLKKMGYPPSEYVTSLLQSGVLGLVRALISAKKAREAIAACDEFLKEHPRLARAPIGSAIALSKAEALHLAGDRGGAFALARTIVGQDPDGGAGAAARKLIRDWMLVGGATPELLLLSADGLMERGEYREALVDLRRCVELCLGAEDRAKVAPAAAFKRGECFRALKQDAEAAVAFQEVFRKTPAHPLANRAALEAIRALIRISAATGDRRDEEQMEKLLDEVERLGLQGDSAPFLRVVRAELLERKGKHKEAADLYVQTPESSEVFDEAMVSAGHCYRLAKLPAAAEAALTKVLARPAAPRLLFTAHYELALIRLADRPKEALASLEKCLSLLPPDSPMMVRLWETEIQARLAAKEVDAAAARADQMMTQAPDAVETLRSCRRVGARFEPTDLAKSAKYYRFWLEHSSGLAMSAAEIQSVADGLYRAARQLNGVDAKALSVLDLKGKPVADRGLWRDAAEAHDRLLRAGGLPEKDVELAELRQIWCAGFAEDWGKSKLLCEKLLEKQAKPGSPAVRFEYGHALFQLGKAGQKFQLTNALTVFNELLGATAKDSEPWWTARYFSARIPFERGQGNDVRDADAVLQSVRRNYPSFDEGRFGLREKFEELRAQVQAALGTQR